MAKQALLDMVRQYGAAETAFDAAKADNVANPPKLQAAYAMMMAAEAGDTSAKDANDLTKAYFEGKGGKMPSSLAQQASKFGVFLKAGDKTVGAQTFTAVHTQINGMNDAKDQRRARSGIFEKFVGIMRLAVEANGVPDYSAMREVLLPTGNDEDATIVALEAAMTALGKAEKAAPGHYVANKIAELTKAVEAAKVLRKNELQGNAGEVAQVTPEVKTEVKTVTTEQAPHTLPAPTLADVVDSSGGMFH